MLKECPIPKSISKNTATPLQNSKYLVTFRETAAVYSQHKTNPQNIIFLHSSELLSDRKG
jgi:hypothetical protein